MESQTDETRAYLNIETGEIVLISDEEFSAAEEKHALESYPEWQRAFRRFKDTVARFRIEDDWHKFRDAKFKELAIEWCEDNKIEYIDDL